MKQYAKREQRQAVARRHCVPIQLEAVYTLAVRSRQHAVCQIVWVTTDLHERRSHRTPQTVELAVASR